MNWINLNVTTLDSEEFLGSEPEQRATWLCLLRYCVGQENGGRIPGARSWTDRKWLQVVRVAEREIATACELWHWDGDDLIVSFYPADKEDEVRERRSRARSNGSKGGRPKSAAAETDVGTNIGTNEEPMLVSSSKPTSVPTLKPTPNPRPKAEGERNEKEKDKEKENEKGNGMEDPPYPPGGNGRSIPPDESSPMKDGIDDDFDDHVDDRNDARSASPQETHVLPRRWRLVPRSERRNHRVHANNRMMQRIGKWFGRKPESLWNLAEGIALSQLDPPGDDVDLLERYYLAPLERKDDYRRRDLLTLLSNWHGELDRARIWQVEQ